MIRSGLLRLALRAAAGWVSLVMVACGDSPSSPSASGDVPSRPSEHGAAPGELQVSVYLSGFLTSRTLTVVVDDTLRLPVEWPSPQDPASAVARTTVPSGYRRVTIGGLEANCETPPPQQAYVGQGRSTNAVSFLVECNAGSPLLGPGLAYLVDAGEWGNSWLVMVGTGGAEQVVRAGYDASDLAWSDSGHHLAITTPEGVAFVDGNGAETGKVNLGLSRLPQAVAWVPGRDALSLLELSETGCRVLVTEAPWTASEVLPCAGSRGPGESSGDLAWSPDGATVAVTSRHRASLSLVSAASGIVTTRILPHPEYVPAAVAWSPSGGGLLVSALCVQLCAPDRLSLLLHDPAGNTWRELGNWLTVEEEKGSDRATLDFLDSGHLVVGPVFSFMVLVPMSAPDEWRPMLVRHGAMSEVTDRWRLNRRP